MVTSLSSISSGVGLGNDNILGVENLLAFSYVDATYDTGTYFPKSTGFGGSGDLPSGFITVLNLPRSDFKSFNAMIMLYNLKSLLCYMYYLNQWYSFSLMLIRFLLQRLYGHQL